MAAAAKNFGTRFWLCLVVAGAVWCEPRAGRAAVPDDDFDEFIDTDLQDADPIRVLRPMAAPQPAPKFAISQFNNIVYGGLAGSSERPISQILQERILAIDLLCGVNSIQKRKLELAGQGDIKRLRDRIDELRQECQLVDDQGGRQLPAPLAKRATVLRTAIDAGPFDDKSVFAKTLRQLLKADQQALYDSYRQLDRRGGKLHLRQRGEREIKAIRMTNAALTDEGLVHFARLGSLEGVLLDYTQVTDEGLIHLAGLTNLELLDLGSTGVRGPGLAHLKNMQCLQLLDLRRTPVTDAGLTHLRSLTELRSLNLGHTRITGIGFARLETLTRLETLLLHQTQFTDEGLSHVQALFNLKELGLEGTQITDTGLAHLARLTHLEKLNLRRTDTTDAGLVHLKGLSSLQNLDLYDTDVSATAIDELKKALPELTVVK